MLVEYYSLDFTLKGNIQINISLKLVIRVLSL